LPLVLPVVVLNLKPLGEALVASTVEQ
jgi:hypothetical protein